MVRSKRQSRHALAVAAVGIMLVVSRRVLGEIKEVESFSTWTSCWFAPSRGWEGTEITATSKATRHAAKVQAGRRRRQCGRRELVKRMLMNLIYHVQIQVRTESLRCTATWAVQAVQAVLEIGSCKSSTRSVAAVASRLAKWIDYLRHQWNTGKYKSTSTPVLPSRQTPSITPRFHLLLSFCLSDGPFLLRSLPFVVFPLCCCYVAPEGIPLLVWWTFTQALTPRHSDCRCPWGCNQKKTSGWAQNERV